MSYQAVYEEHNSIVNSVVAQRQSQADKAAADAAAAARAVAEREAAIQAQKQAAFDVLKPLVDKVFFAYTLQRASDAQLDTWTQQLIDGASVESVVSAFRNSESSMYFGASAASSIQSSFLTLFGRSATATESARYMQVDPLLIPGVIALQAAGVDAETLQLRQQFAGAVRDYYEGTSIPLTKGLPAMKAKEKILTLLPGRADLVENAVRDMGDFLAEWGRAIRKPESSLSDIEPPKGDYMWSGTDYGVAFYEPVNGGSGRILLTFNEPVDWAAMDKNNNGQLEIGSEIDFLLSNANLLGSGAGVSVSYGVTSLVINRGAGAVTPDLHNDSNATFDTITVVAVTDYQGNSGAALFAL